VKNTADIIGLTAMLVLVALLAVGVNVGFIDLVDRGAALRPIYCLTEMLAVLEGIKDAAVCPVSKRPFAAKERDGWTAVSCPDPDQHLGYKLSLLRKGSARRAEVGLAASPEPGPAELRTLLKRTRLTEVPGKTKIVSADHPLSRYLLCPLILGLALPLTAVFAFRQLSRGRARRTLGGDLLLSVLIAASVIAAWQAGRRMAHSRETVIDHREGTVVIQDTYFGRLWGEPELLTDPRVVFPVPAVGGTHLAVLIHLLDGHPQPKILYKAVDQDLAAVSRLNAALGTTRRTEP